MYSGRTFGIKNVLQLKLPNCEVIMLCPTYRFDEPKAQLTLKNIRNKVVNSEIPVISNDNITDRHIGSRRGLHLNERGSGWLIVNFLPYMRRHWQSNRQNRIFTPMPQSYLKNINNGNVSDACKMKTPNLFQVNFCVENDVTILNHFVPLYVPVSNRKCSFAGLRETACLH